MINCSYKYRMVLFVMKLVLILVQQPCVVPGNFIGANDRRQVVVACSTHSLLSIFSVLLGLRPCYRWECVGGQSWTVEGIVADTAPPPLRGLATFVDSQQILQFIDQVVEEEELGIH
eukprot:30007-Hanusia_phi.AAC.2